MRSRRSLNGAEDEGISLDDIVERVYTLSMYSLGSEYIAEETAVEIADNLAAKWTQERLQNSSAPAIAHRVKKNRAFQIDQLTYFELNKYKKAWISRFWAEQRGLDAETMTVWYVEEIVNYALHRNSSYVAIGICKLLFNYSYHDVESILDRVDDDRFLSGDELRRRKKILMDHLSGNSLLADFLTLDDSGLGKELRFVRQKHSECYSPLVRRTMNIWTPMKPSCPASAEGSPASLEASEYDPEVSLMAPINGTSEQELERERMHTLLHPKCLSRILQALKLRPAEETLEIPEFSAASRDVGEGRPPIDRNEPPRMSEEQRHRIKSILNRRDLRRAKPSYRSVLIIVDDGEGIRVSLDGKNAVRLRLEQGNHLIKLKGEDQYGDLALNYYFIILDENLADQQPQHYTTLLGNGRQLCLELSYEKDVHGDPTVAAVEISCSDAPQRVAHDLLKRIKLLLSLLTCYRDERRTRAQFSALA